MLYQSKEPYPQVQVEQPNMEYGKLLLEDYAGPVSEDTAVHLYSYQFLIANEEEQKYADMIHHIAEVEMHHLQLLGETIKKLGVRPVYGILKEDNIHRLWNAGNVNYQIDLKRMLEIDIVSEQQAIKNYQRHIEKIDDIYVKRLLNRIIQDEKIHLSIFQELYQTYFRPKEF